MCVELCFHSPIRFHGVVVRSTGTTSLASFGIEPMADIYLYWPYLDVYLQNMCNTAKGNKIYSINESKA